MRAPVVPTFTPPPRGRSYTGLSVSTAFHVLLLFLILSPYLRRYHILDPNGTGLPGAAGGGGSGGEQYIALPALRPFAAAPAPKVETPVTPPVTPPPTVVPTVIPPPTPAPDTIPTPAQRTATDSNGAASGSTNTGAGQGGSGGGTGGGQGPGTGTGRGPGNGGGERGTPPSLRGFPVPPTEGVPKALRGKELAILCYVGLDGRIERYEFAVEIADAGFRRTLADVVQGFRFSPARDSTGAIVRGQTVVTLTLPNH